MTEKIEKSRLRELLERANVPQQQRDHLEPVIENMAFMRCRLEELAKELREAPLVVEWANGDNQRGTHQSPVLKSYLDIWRGYVLGLKEFSAVLPKDLAAEAKADLTVLDQVRRMRAIK